MAIGRISGSMLKSNLTRNGVDLAFETNILYLDVTNSRVGIGTSSPSTALQVSGTTTTTGLVAGGLTYPTTDGAANQVLVTNGSGTLSFTSLNSFAGITFVGDDSSGSTINTAETLKFTGATGITTSVVDDTVTITGPNLSSYLTNSPITVVGDDSTGTTLNTGETIKIAGAGGITTAVSGDVLTITGSNPAQGITVVGDDSTGTRISDGETLKIAGTSNITTAISGDVLTITGSKDINVNSISSGDSSAIQINDNVNVSGTFNAKTIVTNDLISEDSTAINVLDGMNVSGTLSVDVLDVNEISSSDSSAIQINDSLNASGTITAASFVTHGTSGNITGVNNIEVNQISSNDSTAVQVADGLNVSGTLTAPTFVTNDISSGDSTAVQINDAVNVSGVITSGSNVIASQNLISNYSSGDEGGEIFLAKPQTNTSIAAGVRIDIYQNKLRFWEDGGTNRGAYIDLTSAVAGVGSDLLTGGGGGGSGTVTSITAGTGLTASPSNPITTTGTISLDFSTVVARVVGDDSTGTDLRVGETIKIGGAGGITTAVSGDTLTITGANQAQGITFFDDASTSTAIPDGGALQITSGAGISTSILGNVLTITNTSTQLEIDGGSAYSVYNAISEALIDGGTA